MGRVVGDAARALGVVAVVLVVPLLVVGVIGPSDASEGPITYRLEWTAPGDDVMLTDLGYQVRVDDLSVSTYSVTLVACQHEHAAAPFTVVSAQAGHAAGVDVALIGGPWVEHALTGSAVEVGTAVADEPSYCEGHIAFGSGSGETLAVSGSYLAPGSGEWRPLDVHTDIDWGQRHHSPRRMAPPSTSSPAFRSLSP